MKSLMMLAFAAASIAGAAPAVADKVVVQRTTVVHRDSGWHAARGHHKRRVCTTRWVNHHRVRNCRWR